MRRLIVWVLWRPRNLALAMLAVVIALGMLVVFTGGQHTTSPPAAAGPTAAPATGEPAEPTGTPNPTASPADPDGDGPTPTSEPEPIPTDPATDEDHREAIYDAALAFVDAWLDTSDPEGWAARVAEHADPGLMTYLETTNLDAIPDAETAPTPQVEVADTYAGTVLVPLDNGTQLRIYVAHDGERWVAIPPSPELVRP